MSVMHGSPPGYLWAGLPIYCRYDSIRGRIGRGFAGGLDAVCTQAYGATQTFRGTAHLSTSRESVVRRQTPQAADTGPNERRLQAKTRRSPDHLHRPCQHVCLEVE